MILLEASSSATLEDCAGTRKALFRRLDDLRLPKRCVEAAQLIFAEISANILKHSSHLPGRIDLKLSLDGISLQLQISDNGPAFEAFNRYWNLAASVELLTLQENGRGLALIAPLVSRAEYRAGTLKNGNVNRFSAEIPLHSHRPKLLLAEDSTPLLATWATILRPFYDVLTASSLGEAIEIARREPVEAILADFHLGDGKGTSLVDVLEEDDRRPPVPILIITGDHDPAIRTDALRRGVDQLLVKPISAPELKAAIADSLQRSARQTTRAFRYFSGEVAREGRIAGKLQIPGFAYRSLSGSASLGSGDFLLQLPLVHGSRLILADVMGHGIAAQAAGHAFSAMLRTVHAQDPDLLPGVFLKAISNVMSVDPMVPDHLMTLVVIDLFADGEVRMASAGHPRPVLARNGTAQPVLLDGPLPGIFRDVSYGDVSFKLKPGERLALVTDGMNTGEKDAGINPPEWLPDILLQHETKSLEALMAGLNAATLRRISTRPLDDWTLIVLEAST